MCRQVFDQHWGTYVGGPNEAARPYVRFQTVAEKALLKEADKYWEVELGYPKWSQRLCLDAGDAMPEKAVKGATVTHPPPTNTMVPVV